MLKTESNPHLKRFPYWLRQSVGINKNAEDTKTLIRDLGINTVCYSAKCPNIHDCFSRKRCTFLILGNFCTRSCRFCAIETKKNLLLPEKEELFRIKEAVKRLDLQEVIITSVTRDDLEDGGSSHFADCIGVLREIDSSLSIEILVPDFLGNKSSIEKVVFAKPDIFSHNVETVPALYLKVRPKADYNRSLNLLRYVKELDSSLTTKSSLMVGLGEERDEVYRVMQDLRDVDCDMITIGQYLMPDSECLEVKEFLHPDEFIVFSKRAKELGFKKYSCSPFTRSSYLD